ncbi:MAG: colicin V production protein [Alteromonadaceae bacterium]|nr:colicin V production protein [Alteromonadaceae bacterium]|tara:strand:- start:1167 stop:1748 length:582 start_codon:yes stop_codon:yes gene_type:complete
MNSNVADLFDQLESAISQLNLFDWFIVIVWLISSGYGIARGFAREALSIIGWVSAFLLANVLADSVSELARNLIDEPTTRFLLGWVLTFIAVLLMFGVIAAFLSKQMRQPGFNIGNRLLGGIFGLLRGVIIVGAISILLRAALPDSDEDLLDAAVLMEPVEWVAEWISANFDRVLASEPTEAVKDTIDSSEML